MKRNYSRISTNKLNTRREIDPKFDRIKGIQSIVCTDRVNCVNIIHSLYRCILII